MIREFWINTIFISFCRVEFVGKIDISLPVQSCSEGLVTYPKLANQPFRRSHFHSFENALSKLR